MDDEQQKPSRNLSISPGLRLSISRKKKQPPTTSSVNNLDKFFSLRNRHKPLPSRSQVLGEQVSEPSSTTPPEIPDDVIYEIVKWLPLPDILNCALMVSGEL
jgi:hypothetical protein